MSIGHLTEALVYTSRDLTTKNCHRLDTLADGQANGCTPRLKDGAWARTISGKTGLGWLDTDLTRMVSVIDT